MASYEELEKKTSLKSDELLKKYRKNAIHSFFKGRYDDQYKETLHYYRDRYLVELDCYKELLILLKGYYFSTKRKAAEKLIDKVISRYQDTYDYYNTIADMNVVQHEMYGMPHIEVEKDQDLIDEVYGITLSNLDIFNYFRFHEGVNFVKEHTHIFEAGDDLSWYGVFPKIEKGILRSYKIIVPKVMDFQTAKVNIHEYKHGLDLYDLIGQQYPDTDEFHEEKEQAAIEEEKKFVSEYIRKKETFIRNK